MSSPPPPTNAFRVFKGNGNDSAINPEAINVTRTLIAVWGCAEVVTAFDSGPLTTLIRRLRLEKQTPVAVEMKLTVSATFQVTARQFLTPL